MWEKVEKRKSRRKQSSGIQDTAVTSPGVCAGCEVATTHAAAANGLRWLYLPPEASSALLAMQQPPAALRPLSHACVIRSSSELVSDLHFAVKTHC